MCEPPSAPSAAPDSGAHRSSIEPANSSVGKRAALALLAACLALFVASLSDRGVTEWCFVNATYYCLMLAVLCWAGAQLRAARGVQRGVVRAWLRENWPGLLIAVAVTAIVGLAVEPGLRVLSDEANLVGTSKNLFASKTATFTVSGKNYYGSYWDVDVAIDRRPTLFPFFVSLVHALCGYSYRNVFVFNLLVLPVFVLLSYRLAKSLAGEAFAVIAALFVVAHPITLISARSGGFDFFCACFAVLVLKSLLEYCREPAPARLATLWLNLCLFAEVRYETALFLPLVVAALLAFRMLTWRALRPHALLYALTPIYLMPRVWQSILRGNVPEQEPGSVAFSLHNAAANVHEYFLPLLSPLRASTAHCALLLALGVLGCLWSLRWLLGRVRERDWRAPETRFAVVVAAWMLLQATIVFTYVWGRAQYPSAARLFIPLDTFLAFTAAAVVAHGLERWGRLVAGLPALGLFVSQVPVASQHRMMNRLTQTRESATTWSYFAGLHEKRILIVSDRPNHFTIMDYGAMNFQTARQDPYLFKALSRRLFQDVYVIQQLALSTNEPLPGYELWPERKLEPVLEFQNDANVLVRVSRVAR